MIVDEAYFEYVEDADYPNSSITMRTGRRF